MAKIANISGKLAGRKLYFSFDMLKKLHLGLLRSTCVHWVSSLEVLAQRD